MWVHRTPHRGQAGLGQGRLNLPLELGAAGVQQQAGALVDLVEPPPAGGPPAPRCFLSHGFVSWCFSWSVLSFQRNHQGGHIRRGRRRRSGPPGPGSQAGWRPASAGPPGAGRPAGGNPGPPAGFSPPAGASPPPVAAGGRCSPSYFREISTCSRTAWDRAGRSGSREPDPHRSGRAGAPGRTGAGCFWPGAPPLAASSWFSSAVAATPVCSRR